MIRKTNRLEPLHDGRLKRIVRHEPRSKNSHDQQNQDNNTRTNGDLVAHKALANVFPVASGSFHDNSGDFRRIYSDIKHEGSLFLSYARCEDQAGSE